MRHYIVLPLAAFTMAMVFCVPAPSVVRAATRRWSGGHVAEAHEGARLKSEKSTMSPAKAAAYHNDQILNRILVKVKPYQKGTFYVTLLPQKPTPGPELLALPSLTLEKLLALAKTHRELVVSGRVTYFDGKSYLMLAPNIYQPGQLEVHVGGKLGRISRQRASHENAAVILHKLLSHSISAPASERITIKPAARVKLPLANGRRPGAWSAPAVAEGTYIWNRMGHLLYDPVMRQWIFVFLSDGRRAPDAPIIILPSPPLATMQALETQKHSRAVLRISGIVTAFRDHNFLMPTYVQLYHNLGRF